MAAAGAEPLSSAYARPALRRDCGPRPSARVRAHATRRFDPDQAGDLSEHAGRVGREDTPLVDAPGRAGIGPSELLDHLDVGRQIELAAAQRARNQQPEQSGVGQRLEEPSWQLTRLFDLLSIRADQGSQFPSYLERRSDVGVSYGHLLALLISNLDAPLEFYRHARHLPATRPAG